MCVSPYGSGQRSLNGPSMFKTIAQYSLAHTDLVCPIRAAHGCAIERQYAIVAAVASLLFRGCPSAVGRLVVAVVVDSVKCMLRGWSRPHISEEVVKSQPSFANGDSSPTVTVVIWGAGVLTSSKHTAPRLVFWRPFTGLPVAVSCGSAPATAFTATAFQKCSSNRLHYSTFTAAEPSRVVVCNRVKRKNRPATKLLSSQVYEARTAAGRMPRSHSSLLSRFGWIGPARSHNLLAGPFHCSINQTT